MNELLNDYPFLKELIYIFGKIKILKWNLKVFMRLVPIGQV